MTSRMTALSLAGAAVVLAAPATASAQGGLLGTVGEVVGGTTTQVTDTLDQLLSGTATTVPTDPLGGVISAVLAPAGSPGAPGTPGTQGATGSTGASTTAVRIVSSSGGGVGGGVAGSTGSFDDHQAPHATVKVLSRLGQIARTRKLRLEVDSDEAGVVAFTAMVRPGLKRRGVPRSVKHSRSVIHAPTAMLAFRQAGKLTVDLRLSAADATRLGRSRNGRMSVAILTADVARNSSADRLKRQLLP